MPKKAAKPVVEGEAVEPELTEEEKNAEEYTETHAEPGQPLNPEQVYENMSPSGETVEQLLARWEGYLNTDRDGYSHFIDNPNTLVGARYEVLQNHVRDLKAALGK